MRPNQSQHPESSGLLVFNCPQCDRKLTVSGKLAGVSGPCPSCGSMISAPLATEGEGLIDIGVVPQIPGVEKPLLENGKPARRRSRGQIVPDSIIDYQHLDRRETTKTLFIATMFILVICACLAVSWFLNTWVRK